MTKLVQMIAIGFGTFVGVGGNIIHVDPEGVDPRATHPLLDERDAATLVTNGWGKPADDPVETGDNHAQVVDNGPPAFAAAAPAVEDPVDEDVPPPATTTDAAADSEMKTDVAANEPGVPPPATTKPPKPPRAAT